MTQIAYNSAIIEVTEVSLFYVNYEFNSTISKVRELTEVTQKVKIQISQLKDLYKILQYNIKFAAEQSAVYYNKKIVRELTLKERNKVYLLHHNVKIKWLSNKLNHIKLRLFLVKKKKESVNYKLTLLSAM